MSERVIKVDSDEHHGDKEAECHLMPCRIEFNETTVKAKEYFWPTIRKLKSGGDEELGREKHNQEVADESSDPILTASFRGRPLQGRKVKLPEGYKGCVLPKELKTNVKATKNFSEFTYWNWDELPKDSDTVLKALQWINISKAIHGSVVN